MSAGRFATPDSPAVLRDARHRRARPAADAGRGEEPIEDDRLRLIFTCCHPALAPDAQVALTLREVCGLTAKGSPRPSSAPAPTLARVGGRSDPRARFLRCRPAGLAARLDQVLRSTWFNGGYATSAGSKLARFPTCPAGRSLGAAVDRCQARSGPAGLMLLRPAAPRAPDAGELVLLDQQDRAVESRAGRGGRIWSAGWRPALRFACGPPSPRCAVRASRGPPTGLSTCFAAHGALAHRRAQPRRCGGDDGPKRA